ncbi:mRNA export factor GLE1-like isoform X2 [Vicia villosa]|uniref:mRNA export factor GLE1-like isoform X2 n=1 Tax=Vicia villosa TaxID=3911 RepID=UPI00273A85AA|nr:mRNA export factor GLE1-like isoform X2 [Vicia villosa]
MPASVSIQSANSGLTYPVGKKLRKVEGLYFVPQYKTESENDDEDDKALVVSSTGKHFTCDDLYVSDSDDSYVDLDFEVQPYLMNKVGEVEGALIELAHEHHSRVTDEVRNKISALKTALLNESQNSLSSLLRVEKYKETRQELDKKFDTQYQRQMEPMHFVVVVTRPRGLKMVIPIVKIPVAFMC